MENTQIKPTATIPIFQINEIKTNQKLQKCNRENAASSGFGLKNHRRSLNRRKRTRENIRAVHHQQKKKVQETRGGGGDDDDDQNKEELERKIAALQRIVPGGETLAVDKLFEETADYILALQCQIKAMKLLTNIIQGLEKEKTKFGA